MTEEEIKQVDLLHKLDVKFNKLSLREHLIVEEATKELQEQIEQMKCWCNCKNYISCLEECCRKNISFEKGICYNCKKWELRR